MVDDTNINETLDRLETLIDTLETGNVSMSEADQLHEEGHQHIDELRTLLSQGDSEVIKRE